MLIVKKNLRNILKNRSCFFDHNTPQTNFLAKSTAAEFLSSIFERKTAWGVPPKTFLHKPPLHGPNFEFPAGGPELASRFRDMAILKTGRSVN